MPFNGSEYILSCIVSVDDSVDTAITISSQWLVPGGINDTISENTETEQQHNLTFRPLRSQDRGEYTCTTTISPQEHTEFVLQTTADNTTSVVVKGKLWQFLKDVSVYIMVLPSTLRTASSWCAVDTHLQHRNRRGQLSECRLL